MLKNIFQKEILKRKSFNWKKRKFGRPINNILYKIVLRLHLSPLIVVTTPICSNTKNRAYFDDLKKVHPEIQNFENAVIADKYFSSCGHMNETGALKFTKIIIANCFSPAQKINTPK